jgi:hypothetical protein
MRLGIPLEHGRATLNPNDVRRILKHIRKNAERGAGDGDSVNN